MRDEKTGEQYILATEKLASYYKNASEYESIREYTGKDLVGITYEPIWNDFRAQLEDQKKDLGTDIHLGENAWKVIIGHHVTTEAGTGIVHIAPAYGEDDFLL